MTDFDLGNRLAEVRARANLTQRALAARAGVPHSQIAMVERNRCSPSVSSLRKILEGLDMSLAEFFHAEPVNVDRVVFAPRDFTDLTSHMSRGKYEGAPPIVIRQVGDAELHGLQILQEVYMPGADTGATPLQHTAHEGGIVVRGVLELTVDKERYVLRPGDAYMFDSTRPHRFRNRGAEPAEVISACTPPYL